MHFDDWTDFVIENSLVNTPNVNGLTPIFFCQNQLSFFRLLASGADINHCNKENKNALFFNHIGNEALISNFIEHNANINKLDFRGYSIFNYPLYNKYPDAFMKYRDSIKLTKINIDKIYVNSYYNLQLLIDSGFKIIISNKREFTFSPTGDFLSSEFQKNLDFIESI